MPANSIAQLPTDWWQHAGTCLTLRDWLQRHVVGLHIGFRFKGAQCDEFFSGFLLQHHGYCFWITAAHVIRTMRSLAADARVVLDHAGWMDHAPAELGGPVPVDIRDLTTGFLDPEGLDFGFVLLSPGYALPMIKNPNLTFLDERIWMNHAAAHPEGYLLLGYPFEWFRTERKVANSEGGPRRRIRQGIACLPVERIEDKGSAANEGIEEFWGHPECFYGQLVPFAGEPRPLVKSIQGMSGGPLLSIERAGDQLLYRLFGVQSSWLPDSRIIRAGRISIIADAVNRFVSDLQSQRDEPAHACMEGGTAPR